MKWGDRQVLSVLSLGAPRRGELPVLGCFTPVLGAYKGHGKGSLGRSSCRSCQALCRGQRAVPEGSVPQSHCPQRRAGQISSWST